MLGDSECMFDNLGPELTAALTESAQLHGDRYLVPIPVMNFFGVGPEHAAWVTRHLTCRHDAANP